MNCQNMYCCVLDSVLYSEFGLVSGIGYFFDVNDGQFRCKINRTSSNFTAFKLNTVEKSKDFSNN